MYTLPDLPYAFNALDPHIDEQTMMIHHDKHHQTYITNLNTALEGHDDLLNLDVDDLIADLDKVPENIRTAVRNNAGGHSNHSFFWKIMSPTGGGEPTGALMDAIKKDFSSFDDFKTAFAQAGLSRFGSGWVWLIQGKDKLEIMSTPNQDSPLMEGKKPLLGCDVWEHAYYLHYQNRRADYLTAWWNVVAWTEVAQKMS
jgi:Fe-Mn family superoxide dismutase